MSFSVCIVILMLENSHIPGNSCLQSSHFYDVSQYALYRNKICKTPCWLSRHFYKNNKTTTIVANKTKGNLKSKDSTVCGGSRQQRKRTCLTICLYHRTPNVAYLTGLGLMNNLIRTLMSRQPEISPCNCRQTGQGGKMFSVMKQLRRGEET